MGDVKGGPEARSGEMRAANSILIKLNQIGTLTLDVCRCRPGDAQRLDGCHLA